MMGLRSRHESKRRNFVLKWWRLMLTCLILCVTAVGKGPARARMELAEIKNGRLAMIGEFANASFSRHMQIFFFM
jgi:hypothetical protein